MITVSFIPEAVQSPRVLLADDHAAMHARAADDLAGGSLGNGCESLAEAERLHPDLIVLDISMPGLEGIEAASAIKACRVPRDARFLAVQKDSDKGAYRTLAATAYVIKACLSSDLVTAIFEALGEDRFV